MKKYILIGLMGFAICASSIASFACSDPVTEISEFDCVDIGIDELQSSYIVIESNDLFSFDALVVIEDSVGAFENSFVYTFNEWRENDRLLNFRLPYELDKNCLIRMI